MNIKINAHSSIQIDGFYFDPFMITKKLAPAKYVFITHTHYDHLSADDLAKVVDENTILIAPKDAKQQLEEIFNNKIIYVKPGDNLTLGEAEVDVFASYNLNKDFHKKSSKWVGYKLTFHGTSYAVVGDTDVTPELEKLSCDVLLVPIGGTYTMTAEEAAKLANTIKPSLVIPTHYNAIVGSKKDEETFIKTLDKTIKYKILIK